jgi:DNA end-binding protein Ku
MGRRMTKKSTTRRSKTRTKTKAKAPARRRRSDEDEDREQGPGQRPIWSGILRLALVSVPVRLFPATKSAARISFHQVHKPSGKRIRYQKIVPGIGPVDTDEIVKGFELESGRYVLLEPEEIEDAKVEARRTLDLVQFVTQGEIDPIWFDRPYFVTAEGEVAEEAYAVLRDALRSTKRLGIGQFVMRGQEYLAAVKPCGDGLLLETMRFADEVREAAPYFADVSDEKPDKELLDLAIELIERKAAPFHPEQFKDRYTDALREMIEEKARTGKPIAIDEGEAPERGAKVIDLVEALKRSVARGERSAPSPRSEGTRRKAS